MDITTLFSAMPGAISQGMMWGIMAIGVFITYKILDIADLSVDGTVSLGAAVFAVMLTKGQNIWLCMLLNSPDCLTVGSIPAKATKADELLNLCISPISARMVAVAIMPIPGIV